MRARQEADNMLPLMKDRSIDNDKKLRNVPKARKVAPLGLLLVLAVVVGGGLVNSHCPQAAEGVEEVAASVSEAAVAKEAPRECMTLCRCRNNNSADRMTPEAPIDGDGSQNPQCLLKHQISDYVHAISTLVVGTPEAGMCNGFSSCNPPHAKYNEVMRQYGNDWPPYGYTMVGKERVENFRSCIMEADRLGIPGAVIELGVWRGGNLMMAAAVVKEAKSGRDLYVYDAFESIPGYGGASSFLENSMATVQDNFARYNLLDSNVHFVKGLFKDTVPNWKKGTPIAVLRIDGNFYDSYQDALYAMYEDVAVGGFVIFDDVMSHDTVMKCWLDFKADHGIPEELQRIDRHSAWFRKVQATPIDQLKKRPPQDINK